MVADQKKPLENQEITVLYHNFSLLIALFLSMRKLSNLHRTDHLFISGIIYGIVHFLSLLFQHSFLPLNQPVGELNQTKLGKKLHPALCKEF